MPPPHPPPGSPPSRGRRPYCPFDSLSTLPSPLGLAQNPEKTEYLGKLLQITPDILEIVDRALDEDLASRDHTTRLIPHDRMGRAALVAKEQGVLAGLSVAGAVFSRLDATVETSPLLHDGSHLNPGDLIATVQGPVGGILSAERTALNFLQRMSGIATETAKYVKAVEGLNARIIDTRKTAPGLRYLDKYAVRMGGGHNHRLNLADGVLIKDNHIAVARLGELSLGELVKLAGETAPHTLKIEVEVETVEQAEEALNAGADIILLDNMSLEEMRRAAALAKGHALTEASGGVTLDNVRGIAETGVDLISVGALTHSPKALDISLDLQV